MEKLKVGTLVTGKVYGLTSCGEEAPMQRGFIEGIIAWNEKCVHKGFRGGYMVRFFSHGRRFVKFEDVEKLNDSELDSLKPQCAFCKNRNNPMECFGCNKGDKFSTKEGGSIVWKN